MKFSQSKFEQPQVSTGKPAVDLRYNSDKATPYLGDEVKIYPEWVLKSLQVSGFTLALNIKQALINRANGLHCLTIREADILCRNQWTGEAQPDLFSLASPLLLEAIAQEGNLITEGVESLRGDTNPFLLRASWNKGIAWRNKSLPNLPQDSPVRIKGEARLQEIQTSLASMRLPIWPHELTQGFNTELLKPEWMSWSQWQSAKKNTVIVTP